MKSAEKITQTAGLVGSLTFLSRIGGYVRDMLIAYFFGASGITDAFYVAFRIPNLLRRLFAEGSLTISFIPVFTRTLETRGKDEAKKVSDAAFTVLLFVLVAVVILGVALSPWIVKLFASGFDSETFELAVAMNRIMFPYILLVSLVALSMGVLNSMRHFFAPAISPLLLNVGIIGTLLALAYVYEASIYYVAIGVIVGGAIQLAFQFPFLKSKGFMFSFTKDVFNPAVKRIALLMSPQVFGVAVYNLNILVSTQYASFLPIGAVSYLYYSERLIEFPLGIAAVSIATALLPNLATYAARGEKERYRKDYSHSLRLMLYVMIPSLVGLIALRIPICSALYQRGEFGYAETVYVSEALAAYALGLWAVGGVRITAPTFYALRDTKTPVIVAFIALVVNAALAYFLAFPLGLKHVGIALASAVSSILHFTILFVLINKRMGAMELGATLVNSLKMLGAALVMGFAAWWIAGFGVWDGASSLPHKLAFLTLSMAAAAVVYFALTKMMRLPEADHLLGMLRRRTGEE